MFGSSVQTKHGVRLIDPPKQILVPRPRVEHDEVFVEATFLNGGFEDWTVADRHVTEHGDRDASRLQELTVERQEWTPVSPITHDRADPTQNDSVRSRSSGVLRDRRRKLLERLCGKELGGNSLRGQESCD